MARRGSLYNHPAESSQAEQVLDVATAFPSVTASPRSHVLGLRAKLALRCLMTLSWAVILLACTAALRAAPPVGLEAMARLDRICELRPGVWASQYSSHDRAGRNYDWTGVLDVDGNEKVLLDIQGPGCIYRIWFTASDRPLNGVIRVYFDGAAVPMVEMSLEQFFGGSHPWFPAPLAGDFHDSSGGYYCYVPMPFRQGCRITSTNSADLNYYNITCHRFATDEGVETFDGSQDLSGAVAIWSASGTDPKPDSGVEAITRMVTAAGGSATILADIPGAGMIQGLELTIPGLNASVLASLRLTAHWDGAATAAVDAPLGPMFGSGLGAATIRGLPIGMIGERLYCWFPMPFGAGAILQFVNDGTASVANIGCTVRYTPMEQVPAGLGRFQARYRRQGATPLGQDYVFVDETGAGHLVGIVQTLRGRSASQWYLEGDERIFIDESRTPALHGTGTEDFYNGGWYFDQGTCNDA